MAEQEELETLLEIRTRDIERTKERLEKEVEKLPEVVAELEAAREEAAPAIKSKENHERMVLEAAQYRESIPGIERKIRENEAILDRYRELFQASLPKLGTSLGDLRLNDGRVLTKAIFTNINGNTIQIRHQGGFTNVAITELPDSLAANFVLPPIEAGNVSIRFGQILNSKPNYLQTSEDRRYLAEEAAQLSLAEEAEEARIRSEEARIRSEEAREEARIRSEEARIRGEEARILDGEAQKADQARMAKTQQRNEIKAKMTALKSRIGELSTEKFEKLSEMNSSKIRRSKADLDKVTATYDNAINALRSQISVYESELQKTERN